MTDTWTLVIAAAAATIWIALILGAYVKLERTRNRKLLRCPESGAITVVDIEEMSRETNSTARWPHLRVRSCELWPERKDCGRGCLIRCSEAWGSYGSNLASLRPFDMHELNRHKSLPH